MTRLQTLARAALGGVLLAEGGMALRRFERRRSAFAAAARRAAELGRPLVVIGDPDAGVHTRLMRAYECGDLCIDLHGCPQCRVMQAADLTAGPVPGIADDSAVVFVSCVLEYVSDTEAALRELGRMAGSPGNLFLVLVEPWSLTAALYPGARWAGSVDEHQISMKPVTVPRKVATLGGLTGLLTLALWPRRAARSSRGAFVVEKGDVMKTQGRAKNRQESAEKSGAYDLAGYRGQLAPSGRRASSTKARVAEGLRRREAVPLPPALMTVEELAALLRTSKGAVYARYARGGIPGAVRLGRTLRFDPEVIAQWLSTSRASAGGQL